MNHPHLKKTPQMLELKLRLLLRMNKRPVIMAGFAHPNRLLRKRRCK